MTESEQQESDDGEYWSEQTYYQAVCTDASHSPMRRMQVRQSRSSAEIDKRSHKHTESVEIIEFDVIGETVPRQDERLSDEEVQDMLTGGSDGE